MQFNFSRFALIVCFALAGLSAGWAAELSSTDASLRTADVTPTHLESLQWRMIGPAVMGGRVTDLAVVESNPAIFYVGTATGNLWKTTSHGTTWEALFEAEAVSSIGDVTLAPSNPNIVWVGSGESNNRQSSPWGNGVYKSVDGGKNWQLMGLEQTRHIGRILIHPTNPDIVYVAATGHLWGPHPERGVFRSLDGGKSWEKVLFVDEDTGATDLAMHPSDPDTILAALYQRRRTAWGFNGGGPGSGIYRSSDGGTNWTRLEEGLPSVPMGRIGLDIFQGDPNLVFATVEADQDGQGLYRSADRGDSWEKVSSTNPRPMYFSQIRVDPSDSKRVYVLGVRLAVSDDGGKTFNNNGARRVHSDHHAMWVDPANPNHLIMGGDGGVSISMDRSQTWRSLNNIPIGQFYEVGFDMQDPYYVCGGLQDNGSWCGPSANRDRRGIRNADWFNVLGGDGFFARIDPHDPNIIFGESQNGSLARIDRATGEAKGVRPTPRADSPGRDQLPRSSGRRRFGFGGGGPSYRFNWNAPLLISAHDPQTIYHGGNVLLRSPDRGNSWQEISPDLSRRKDRNKLEIMGVAGEDIDRARHDGVRHFGTITSLSESPLNPDILYAGTDDGNLHVTRNGGQDWVQLNENIPVPDGTYVSRVVASRAAQGRAYATFDGHYNDDYRAYAFVTEDFGASWTSLSEGLPETSINVITEHFRNTDLLFVGNEIGVYFSVDRGASWLRLKNNLPTVPVDDIQVHPRENDLIIGTHGRSVWIMDDITPLEQLASASASALHLFAAKRATLFNPYSPQGWVGDAEFSAPNPPQGAQIRYFVSEEVASKLEGQKESAQSGQRRRGRRLGAGQRRPGAGGFEPTPEMRRRRAERRARRQEPKAEMRITDADGNVLRTLEGPVGAGIQTAVWDLRLEPPYTPDPDDPPPQGRRRFGGRPQGPRVLPGSYGIEVEIDGKTVKGSLEVRGDPRIRISQADLKARQEALMKLYRISKPAYEVGRSMRRLQDQLQEVEDLLEGSGEAGQASRDLAEEISKELEEIQSGPARAAQGARRLGSGLERSTSRPTPGQLRQIEEAVRETVTAVERVNQLITDQFPALYKALNKAGIRPDPGSPIDVPKIGG